MDLVRRHQCCYIQCQHVCFRYRRCNQRGLTSPPVIVASRGAWRRKKKNAGSRTTNVRLQWRWRCEKGSGRIRVIQYQTTRRRSGMLIGPEAAVTWPFDPLQLFQEAITWRVTVSRLTREETVGKRSRAGGSTGSDSCFINWSFQTKKLQVWCICRRSLFVFLPRWYFFFLFIYPRESFVFTPRSGSKVGQWRNSWRSKEKQQRRRKQLPVVFSGVLASWRILFFLLSAALRQVINKRTSLNQREEKCGERREKIQPPQSVRARLKG